jgi:hypothetical protein
MEKHPLGFSQPSEILRILLDILVILEDVIKTLVRIVIDPTWAVRLQEEEPTIFYICAIVWLLLILFAFNFVRRAKTFDDGSMDSSTQDYLSAKWSANVSPCYKSATCPKDAQMMIKALEDMPFTHNCGECAKQMQTILKASHIPYSSLIDAPENLLRVSPGHEGQNGGL